MQHLVGGDAHGRRDVVVDGLQKGLALHLRTVRLGKRQQDDVDGRVEATARQLFLPMNDVVPGERPAHFG